MSGRCRRRLSATRNTAARYAQTTTASVPPSIDVGSTQLDTARDAPFVGTRPEATPPATAPKKNGVTTDESAKAAPYVRWTGVRTDTRRNANPAPRSTMPNAASPIGTYSVSMIDANAVGKPVHSTTRQ